VGDLVDGDLNLGIKPGFVLEELVHSFFDKFIRSSTSPRSQNRQLCCLPFLNLQFHGQRVCTRIGACQPATQPNIE